MIPIKISPLRERGDDILLLTEHYLDVFSRRHGKPKLDLSETASAILKNYHWSGNVRELKNVVERAVQLKSWA